MIHRVDERDPSVKDKGKNVKAHTGAASSPAPSRRRMRNLVRVIHREAFQTWGCKPDKPCRGQHPVPVNESIRYDARLRQMRWA